MVIRPASIFCLAAAAATLSSSTMKTTHAFATNGKLGWGPLRSTGLAATIENANSEISMAESKQPNENDEVKTADVLSLDSIRSTLIRQEETIIFAIIERAQYRHNCKIYDSKGFADEDHNLGLPLGCTCESLNERNEPLSFLEYMLIGTEILHCGVRRYTSPEEHSFFPDCLPSGPNAALPQLEYPSDLLSPIGDASSVNFNPVLLEKYVEWVVPKVAKKGDDEQHGSAVLADIAVLQALSKRIHYGKFVAESKYRSDPKEYQRLVEEGDADGVMKLLTNEAVEEKVLSRARIKAATYGREPLLTSIPNTECHDTTSFVASAAASAVATAFEAIGIDKKGSINGKVDPAAIEDIYRKFIIPLTKDVEVAYLFRRCGRDPPPEYAPDRMSTNLHQD